MKRYAIIFGTLNAVACGRPGPAPLVGSGVEAPTVAPGLPADFTFRWPEPARARVTLRVGEGERAIAAVSDLLLEAPDIQGIRHLRMTEWTPRGGKMGRAFASVMQRHSEDGLLVRSDGTTVDEAAGASWYRWVEAWFLFVDAPEGVEKHMPSGELPPGLELRVLRQGTSVLHPQALELTYWLTAVDKRGEAALVEILQLSQGVVGRMGPPKAMQFIGHVDPRTVQPLRIDMFAELERSEGPKLLMSVEFDWVQ